MNLRGVETRFPSDSAASRLRDALADVKSRAVGKAGNEDRMQLRFHTPTELENYPLGVGKVNIMLVLNGPGRNGGT
jgi:hypothetical protein